MQIRKGGSWRTITSAQAYINGAWRQILFGQAYKTTKWRNVCNFTVAAPPPTSPPPTTPGLTVTATPSSDVTGSPDTIVESDPITATPSGGRSPYTYQWSVVTSDGHTFTFTAGTSATTTVIAKTLNAGTHATCTINCVVNDSTGLTGTSNTVSINLQNTSPPGGPIP